MLQVMRSAWSMVHPNINWAFVVDGRDVLANFDQATETNVIGSAVDCYGWWHRQMVLNLTHVTGLVRFTGDVPTPEPEPFRVGVRLDFRRDFIRLVVPDDVARRLSDWSEAHWHEYHGIAYGFSDTAEPGSWEHRAMAYLHSIQSLTRSEVMTMIQGESYTSGVKASNANPTTGFHFTG